MVNTVCIVGGGPIGCALGVTLRRAGMNVHIYERYMDIRIVPTPGGRSINLVLTNRGLRLAADLGIKRELLSSTVTVSGRMMHPQHGSAIFQPYGRSGECNYSIDRSLLNKFWLNVAERSGCQLHFDHALTSLDSSTGVMCFLHSDGSQSTVSTTQFDVLFGSDGGGSVVRNCLSRAGAIQSSESLLPAGYKEILFPVGADDSPLLDPHSLHIWARDSHMLMALANLDGSFTGTIFMDREGGDPQSHPSFALCTQSRDTAEAFWNKFYPDALELTEKADTIEGFVSSKVGILGTVRCHPWHSRLGSGTQICLIGDAAHAIVPFFGQGVNCGFEDVFVLKQLIASSKSLSEAVERFGVERKIDSDAIADLALENFDEMRSKVADSNFLFRKKLDGFIMNAFPTKYRTRYTLVMYSENPYSVCKSFGEFLNEFLSLVIDKFNLCESSDLSDIDLETLESLVDKHVTPRAAQLGVSFDF